MIKRSFFLGDDWLYYKLFLGEFNSDLVLTDFILPFVKKHLTDSVSQFFYIRYSEGGYHLRLRFLVEDKSKLGDLIIGFHELIHPLVERKVIYKVQTDTYERELERYYNRCMPFAENIFSQDSIMVVNYLHFFYEQDLNEDERWLFAIHSIDALLSNFGFNLDDKLRLSTILNDSFSKEFQINKYMSKELDFKYRASKDKIQNAMSDPFFTTCSGHRYTGMKSSILEIKNHLSENDTMNILTSLIHMSCNRIFRSSPRENEFVLYHFLWKYYRSETGKQKYL
ncbi:thiopeptide-type bacteriocin biosynthesis protein [Chryseobacterium sp. OV279]|uniref:thiopeptide-type bacteriocin biosynthesis protein n=1 Tax=Chryseobacterium sp. OV279 TaxID=1500285 RepID=UPI00091F56FB|nr:thiopeptide-type bacteriocin biosynthesis protein [Chryseobacterium sp. OV279]SHF41247.1 thiopeptide-type bacteriocin biosynthesis domain-containing protein [Chryseobacterium sp. OV279]